MLRVPPGEILNTLTHGAGAVLSAVGAILLVGISLSTNDPWRIAGCAVFGMSMLAVYVASTLSHAVADPAGRRFYRILDQGFIYILIVGTYTPFALAFSSLRTPGWLLFLAIMWAIALAGLASKLLLVHRIEGIAVWSYLLLGWMPIVPAVTTLGQVPVEPLWMILIGGLFYTLGTVFLMVDKQRYHFHAIWHLLVITGSGCHFLAVLWYVATVPAA